jgi:hypothetical protein
METLFSGCNDSFPVSQNAILMPSPIGIKYEEIDHELGVYTTDYADEP